MADDPELSTSGFAKYIFDQKQTPEWKAREAEMAAEHKAHMDTITDEQLCEQLRGFAHRIGIKPGCPSCTRISYADALNHVRALVGENQPWDLVAWARNRNLTEMQDVAGYMRYCDTCAALPDERPFAFAMSIPVHKFREFMEEHWGAFALEELKKLPRYEFPMEHEHGQTPDVPGAQFQILRNVPMTTRIYPWEVPTEPKGGFVKISKADLAVMYPDGPEDPEADGGGFKLI